LIKKQAELEAAIEIAKLFPYKWVGRASIRIEMEAGEPNKITVMCQSPRFPTDDELRELVKYAHLTIEKQPTTQGFPKLQAKRNGVTLRIYCHGCPQGYEAIIEHHPRTIVKRTCKLIQQPKT